MEPTIYVYVQNADGSPLMPTTRCGKVRRMLDDGKAVVVDEKPFMIRLKRRPRTSVTQEITIAPDPGRTNIGLATVRDDGKCLYLAHAATRNKKIPGLMSDRKCHRQASRRGERLARKRLVKKLGTTAKHLLERILPGCGKPLAVKDIINTESRFNNRYRPKGWLTPTAVQLLRTHINLINGVRKILPVSRAALEVNQFAFMALEDPTIWEHRADFQNGPLKGLNGVHAAVYQMQGGKCLLCRKKIEHYHHVLPKKKGGADTIANIAGLCLGCHDRVHKDQAVADKLDRRHGKRNKKYGALSVLNQIIPALKKELEAMFPGKCTLTTGYQTAKIRELLGIEKDHPTDAYCIALSALPARDLRYTKPGTPAYEILQFRRHDRARINNQRERTYYLDKKKIAKNRRKRTEQKTDALEDWYEEQVSVHGEKEAEHMRSRLTVKKSVRYYNNPKRLMPGTTFRYQGQRYVMTGQISNGDYLRAYGQGDWNFPAKDCRILQHNTGLVYI